MNYYKNNNNLFPNIISTCTFFQILDYDNGHEYCSKPNDDHFRASWITSCIHAWIPACWWLRSAFHPRSPQRELKGEGMRGKEIGEGEWLPEDRQEPPRVGVEN